MKKPKVLILRTAGTNCDFEVQSAFEMIGAIAQRVHVKVLIENKDKIFDYDILVFPGGFSYGDDIASGKILANEIKNKLGDNLQKFAADKRPIIGICNGFQVLVKMGLLPDEGFKQVSTLSYNDSGKFECRWVYLKTISTKSLWVKNLAQIITLPIAHGEGKFLVKDNAVLENLQNDKKIVFKYCTANGDKPYYPLDPNGSIDQIAALCNSEGNVFGLMPHPERYVFALQHPARQGVKGKFGWGKIIFQNAIDYCRG
jgi:phosphoribosylformylglycinamidine synthase